MTGRDSSGATARWVQVAAGALLLVATACSQGRSPAQSAALDDANDAGAAADPLFDEEFTGPQVPDPLEPVNRPVFAANMAFDRAFVDPVSRAYGAVTPAPIKTAVRSFFRNLNAPVVMINEVLQAEPKRAAETLGRFVLNSTLGLGGVLNPAGEFGWTEHHADFGQTLGKYGAGPGFYVVLPLLGPSTARDSVGAAVDLFLRIDTWLLPLQSQIFLGGGFGISERDSRREELEALRSSSIDFYAAVRSAYLQTRAARVREARER